MAADPNRRARGAQSHQSTMALALKSAHRCGVRSSSTAPSRAISKRSNGDAVSSATMSTSRLAMRPRATASPGRRGPGTPMTAMSISLWRCSPPFVTDPKTAASRTSGSEDSAVARGRSESTCRILASAPGGADDHQSDHEPGQVPNMSWRLLIGHFSGVTDMIGRVSGLPEAVPDVQDVVRSSRMLYRTIPGAVPVGPKRCT